MKTTLHTQRRYIQVSDHVLPIFIMPGHFVDQFKSVTFVTTCKLNTVQKNLGSKKVWWWIGTQNMNGAENFDRWNNYTEGNQGKTVKLAGKTLAN